VLFWGCFSNFGLGPLVVIDGSMDASKYLEILKHYVLPELQVAKESFGVDLCFVQDNAPCHKARHILVFLTQHNVETLNWPARPPD
jgi:hypothetical protein